MSFAKSELEQRGFLSIDEAYGVMAVSLINQLNLALASGDWQQYLDQAIENQSFGFMGEYLSLITVAQYLRSLSPANNLVEGMDTFAVGCGFSNPRIHEEVFWEVGITMRQDLNNRLVQANKNLLVESHREGYQIAEIYSRSKSYRYDRGWSKDPSVWRAFEVDFASATLMLVLNGYKIEGWVIGDM